MLKIITESGKEINFKEINYPSGEFDFNIIFNHEAMSLVKHEYVVIKNSFSNINNVFKIPFLVNALIQSGFKEIKVQFDYLPFSRQDRSFIANSSFGLESFIKILSGSGVNEIIVDDPHNEDVLSLLCSKYGLKITVNTQNFLIKSKLNQYFSLDKKTALVCPDKGALKKIIPLSNELGLTVVLAEKTRSLADGKIVDTKIVGYQQNGETTLFLNGVDFLNNFDKLIIVDDICDGGATFIALADVIRNLGYKGELILVVTHGFFSKGLEPLLAKFDSVLSIHNYSKI